MPGASICRYLRKGRRPRLAMLGYAYADTCKTVCHRTKTGRNCRRWPLAPSIWMAGPDLATGVRAWQWSAYAAATRPHREPESAVAIKQRGCIAGARAFDREQPKFCRDPAVGGEAARLAAGREHAVAWNDDRKWIAPQRLTHLPRQAGSAEPCRD